MNVGIGPMLATRTSSLRDWSKYRAAPAKPMIEAAAITNASFQRGLCIGSKCWVHLEVPNTVLALISFLVSIDSKFEQPVEIIKRQALLKQD